MVFEGPDLTAAIGFHHAARAVGDEWLILATQFAGPNSDGGSWSTVPTSPSEPRTAVASRLSGRRSIGKTSPSSAFRSNEPSYLPILGRSRRQPDSVPSLVHRGAGNRDRPGRNPGELPPGVLGAARIQGARRCTARAVAPRDRTRREHRRHAVPHRERSLIQYLFNRKN